MAAKGAGTGDGTVGKALQVLDCVAAAGHPVKFTELLEKSPHPKATLYRLLQTLTNQGMLSHDPETGTYTLGLRLVKLAHSAWKQATLATVARPFVDVLAAKVGETIHLAQMEQGQVLFVDKQKMSDRFETLAQTGRVAPGYCTGVGKAILANMTPERQERALRQQHFLQNTATTHTCRETLSAELDRIRAEGVAFDREEHETGIISIAAPILTNGGRVIGALSIATSTTRHSLDSLRAFEADLLHTARKIGEEATPWQFPTVN
ncbi:IclR family transcriptional regulator [Rhodobacteraceae bacterium W635]|uniref:IclR family transcriptional regulator n=1 Tax=Paracoccaceae TaxID=31989 RepID=UPI000E3EA792|nr:IclR family transcriptional regulator [Rhodobacteraceae bacterium W635]